MTQSCLIPCATSTQQNQQQSTTSKQSPPNSAKTDHPWGPDNDMYLITCGVGGVHAALTCNHFHNYWDTFRFFFCPLFCLPRATPPCQCWSQFLKLIVIQSVTMIFVAHCFAKCIRVFSNIVGAFAAFSGLQIEFVFSLCFYFSTAPSRKYMEKSHCFYISKNREGVWCKAMFHIHPKHMGFRNSILAAPLPCNIPALR